MFTEAVMVSVVILIAIFGFSFRREGFRGFALAVICPTLFGILFCLCKIVELLGKR